MADDPETEQVEDQETPAETEEVEEIEGEEPDGEEPEGDGEEAEAEADGEAEDGEEEPPRRQRGSDRDENLGNLRRQNTELRERLDRIERGQQQRPDPNAEQERQRREAAEEEQVLLTGDVGKIAKFYSDRSARESRAQISQVVNHVVDAADKTEFRALCAENPALKAIAADVEKQLVQSRAQGLNPKREALAKYLLGERMLSRAKGAKTRQEKTAAQGRERQRARPGASRSDVNSSGRPKRDSQAERAKRLDESGML